MMMTLAPIMLTATTTWNESIVQYMYSSRLVCPTYEGACIVWYSTFGGGISQKKLHKPI